MLGSRNSVLTHIRANATLLLLLPITHAVNYPIIRTIQILYYFHKSPKRQRMFEGYQSFTECKPHKLLKAAQTRWLSLEACVNHLLEQYEALLSYFQSTEENSAIMKRITEALEKPITKAYLMFLSDSLPVINNFNEVIQQQASTIHFSRLLLKSFYFDVCRLKLYREMQILAR